WKAAVAGNIVHAAIFDGEECDARIAPPYSGSPFLKQPVANAEFGGEILPSDGAEIRRRFDLALKPVEAYVWRGTKGAEKATQDAPEIFGTVRKLRSYAEGEEIELFKGETLVVDFGQNAAAVPAFAFAAAEGTALTCLPAEMLNDGNGERSRGNDGPAGSAYRENLRVPDRGMRIRYIFGRPKDGEEWQVYFPTHTFFGYRYISVSATDTVKFKAIASIPVTSISKEMEKGRISTGVEDVNKLVSNIYWGQLSNYLSVPTDCPQRNERLGWTADTQVFCEAGSFNADTSRFLEKWMRDMSDSRDDDGGFPSVAPLAQYGNETFNLGWADAGVIVPWTVWKQFGDTRIVEDNFEAMAKFVRKLDETKYKYDDRHYTYADWLSYETFETCGNEFGGWWKWQNDPDAIAYREFLAACYWHSDAKMMSEMADAVGKGAEARYFRSSAARAMEYIRKTYVEDDGLLLKPMRHLQTACIFALRFGVVEGKAREATKELLLKSIREHGDCLQTGFLGTGFIMDTLTEIGASDVAYTLLLQHKNPSWLYSVDQGATTIWERWNSYTKENGFGPVGMNSFNHYAYGSVLAWMYKTMAGIASTTADPGFRTVVMAPRPDRRIGSVEAEYDSAAGLIKSAWEYDGDLWIWNFTVPDGAKAIVRLEGEPDAVYMAGSHKIVREAAK
ncbi:MAG: family 78 glycoside hydrolase catalytic domain, partial [Kiritimatiellae bacterium]|nr:family 78 glycoside hydrolase catalytic domain [Kiritimatiellia bacterium]